MKEMQLILEFMYKGAVSIPAESYEKVQQIADHLEMTNFKKLGESNKKNFFHNLNMAKVILHQIIIQDFSSKAFLHISSSLNKSCCCLYLAHYSYKYFQRWRTFGCTRNLLQLILNETPCILYIFRLCIEF